MDRVARIRGSITKDQLGIEIAPWLNPIVPKRDGYKALSLDILDYQELMRRAHDDSQIPREKLSDLEEVDFVAPVMLLGEMVRTRELTGKIDYIISSHNFEHIPDPTRFLQNCEEVLKPGGVLSMAIPDHRRCFDLLRPQSTIGAVLEAYVMCHQKPTISQVFDSLALKAHRNTDAGVGDWEIGIDPAEIYLRSDLEGLCEFAQRSHKDAHCWTFTPASFSAIIRDLQLLRLVRMTLTEVSEPNGNEFYITMTNRPAHLQNLGRPVDLLREAAGI